MGSGIHGKSLRYIFTSGAIKAVGVPLVRPFIRSFVRSFARSSINSLPRGVRSGMDRARAATILIVVYSSSPYNTDG